MIIRHIRICIHIYLTQNTIQLKKGMQEIDRVAESMVTLLQLCGSKNVGLGRVCVFVI
jgi:hypothetical protein